MKIQIVLFDETNLIIKYKDFYINPPKASITQEYIDEFVRQGLKLVACRKIEITKWEHKREERGISAKDKSGNKKT